MRQILRRPLGQGAADGWLERLVVQIDPVDDAVFGAGKLLLDLPGRVIRVDPHAQRANDREVKIDGAAGQERIKGELSAVLGQFQLTVAQHYAHDGNQGQGGEAEQSGRQVEKADAALSAGKLRGDEGIVLAAGRRPGATRIDRHRCTPWLHPPQR